MMRFFLYAHLATILPALALGPVVLLRRKGDVLHKRLGKTWAVLMVTASLLSFGIMFQGRPSWLHGLAAFTIFSVWRGVRAAKRRDLRAHKGNMIGSYAGTVAAFIFALMPGRMAGDWVRNRAHEATPPPVACSTADPLSNTSCGTLEEEPAVSGTSSR